MRKTHGGERLVLVAVGGAGVLGAVGAYNVACCALRSTKSTSNSAVLEEVLLKYQSLVQEATTAAADRTCSGGQTAVAPELGASHWTRLQVAARFVGRGHGTHARAPARSFFIQCRLVA